MGHPRPTEPAPEALATPHHEPRRTTNHTGQPQPRPRGTSGRPCNVFRPTNVFIDTDSFDDAIATSPEAGTGGVVAVGVAAANIRARTFSVALSTAGLDVFTSFLHGFCHGRPALALDLLEPARPRIAESAVLRVLNTGMLRESQIETDGPAVRLGEAGRRALLDALEGRLDQTAHHDGLRREIAYRDLPAIEAARLARALRRDEPPPAPYRRNPARGRPPPARPRPTLARWLRSRRSGRAVRRTCRRRTGTQPPPLIAVPLDLSDEAAAKLADFLLQIAHQLESHYSEQLDRYHNGTDDRQPEGRTGVHLPADAVWSPCPRAGAPARAGPRPPRGAASCLTSRCLSQPAGHPRERPSRPAVLPGGIPCISRRHTQPPQTAHPLRKSANPVGQPL